MDNLRDPVCADCVSYMAEQRDDDGKTKGRCRFRPEMGLISQSLPYCHLFQVRRECASLVKIPPKSKKVAGRPGARRSSTDDDWTPPRTLKGPTVGDTTGEITMDRNGLKQVLREILEEETLYGYPALGPRWRGGTLIIKPENDELQSKEVPLETFFHKIVMLRDRLRVLEAKLNGNKNLAEADKIELQGYISKAYGTLTTFNALFRDKSDFFSSK